MKNAAGPDLSAAGVKPVSGHISVEFLEVLFACRFRLASCWWLVVGG